jgi:hypothetical protein
MKVTLFIAFLLLTSAFAAETDMEATSESESDSTRAGGAADLLLDHLDNIETQIRFEQAEHQRLYESQKVECDDEIKIRTTAVVDGEDALRKAEAHYIRCQSGLHEANADLA